MTRELLNTLSWRDETDSGRASQRARQPARLRITFDSRSGPINIRVGPNGGLGAFRLTGADSLVPMSQSPNVHTYVRAKTTVKRGNGGTIDAGIYTCNRDGAGPECGAFQKQAPCTVNGGIIVNNFFSDSELKIHEVRGLFTNLDYGRFVFDNAYTEVKRPS